MQVGCGNEPLVGVNVPYYPESDPSTISLTDDCNADCTCTQEYYNPICFNSGSQSMTYFTPCHAGCTKIENSTRHDIKY